MSTSEVFLNRLRAGLKGLPSGSVRDIMADYSAHFTEAAAAGRGADEVAAKLGDPARLARELRAEAGMRRWEQDRSAASALGAIVGVLTLATLDLFILLPVLIALGATVFALMIAGLALSLAGAVAFAAALVHALPGFGGTWLQGILLGLGIASGGASLVALCTLVAIGTVNLLVRYARLHLRVVSPTPLHAI